MKKGIGAIVILAFCLAAFSTAFSQEREVKMRQEIVKLKYLDANGVMSLLMPLKSREGNVSPSMSGTVRLALIRDFPENIEKMLEAIREYDVKPADIQFTIQLLLGSLTGETKAEEEMPASDPIIKELRSLLQYKSFSLLDSSYIRAIDREESEVTMGKDAELRLRLKPAFVKDGKENLIQVEARLNKILLTGPDLAKNLNSISLLASNFTMKSGEKTVVGVSKMDGGDKALILIISGKIVD